MKKITIEMPTVAQCAVSDCAYNQNSNCHARAITIGDATHPGCDTFMKGAQHAKSIKQIAGIGACKTGTCKFNEDLECVADSIQVSMVHNQANCMTFAMR
ncbi:MAG TPA: DUF1540 domain-containing protein [Sideroxyarcus sp.]|nr:DUF1540 domain-containing protein [Sideroxyarcus sp.]